MKTKTKTSKRIFSLFLAVLCVLGVFFVSYIPSSATTSSVKIDYNFGFNENDLFSKRYLAPLGTSNSLISVVNTYVSVDISPDTVYQLKAVYSYVSGGSRRYTSGRWYYNNSELSTYSGSPTLIDFSSEMVFLCQNTYSGSDITYYVQFVNFPTPTPTPAPTPTPTPAVTPVPGGSIPTPSGDYGSFFQRMASDAQSAFNALYLSWTNANNRFYSSIFFIGLPLLITVFGIVAGIILGDDD